MQPAPRLGGVARLLLGGWIQNRFGPSFPIGTLVINVTGSLLLGFLLR
jgi:CrcB protein